MKTVLVVGAGANADFKLKNKNPDKNKNDKEKISMPTGEQLVEKIADWEGQVLPNLVYGYILGKAQELNFSDINWFESISKFVINKNEEWGWQNQILPQSQYPVGGGAYLNRKKLLIEIGWDWNCSKFYKNWTSKKIQESELFSWYHKISEIVKHYQPFSIDEMLDSIKMGKVDVSKWIGKTKNDQDEKEKLIKAGKHLIALFLLQSEDKKVFDYEASCWYRHLRNAIITCGKNKKEIEEKLKNFVIISFNYDRSLDYFLRTKVGEFYQDITIEYPYGSLAKEEIWNGGDYKKIPYGTAKKENSFQKKWEFFQSSKKLAKNLEVIGELEKSKEGKEKIHKLKKYMIDSAIYFLGFAFHEENCRIMGMLEKRFQGSNVEIIRALEANLVFYTNCGNSAKTKDGFDSVFNSSESRKNIWQKGEEFFEIGRSSYKGTYEALSQDFNLRLY